ncbi:sugar phosphate isomerase/epimerase [Leucobacter sp. wl10]|uniref:sugar phosphate isomerase/epimerase family protein n=1 Tax=Leucobacter sp. wl10 TaxID=2304677 RepID=UPI0013C2B67A|nr:sugar phosphate isomerase/epimerase [Leucobacter sp. wl10]
MSIGIFSRTFAVADPDDAFAAAKAAGYDGVHLNLATIDTGLSPAGFDDRIADLVRRLSGKWDLELYGISASYNIAHPDPADRRRAVDDVLRTIEAAPSMGIDFVSLSTGSRSVESTWRYHPDNATDEAWADARSSLEQLAASAERVGVRLGVEPEPANVVADARLGLQMLDEVGSDAVRIILDPANLLFAGDGLNRQSEVLEEAYELLGDRTDVVHAKEIGDGEEIAAGDGPIDFGIVFALTAALGRDVPVIAHNLSADDAARTAEFIQEGMVKAHDS